MKNDNNSKIYIFLNTARLKKCPSHQHDRNKNLIFKKWLSDMEYHFK